MSTVPPPPRPQTVKLSLGEVLRLRPLGGTQTMTLASASLAPLARRGDRLVVVRCSLESFALGDVAVGLRRDGLLVAHLVTRVRPVRTESLVGVPDVPPLELLGRAVSLSRASSRASSKGALALRWSPAVRRTAHLFQRGYAALHRVPLARSGVRQVRGALKKVFQIFRRTRAKPNPLRIRPFAERDVSTVQVWALQVSPALEQLRTTQYWTELPLGFIVEDLRAMAVAALMLDAQGSEVSGGTLRWLGDAQRLGPEVRQALLSHAREELRRRGMTGVLFLTVDTRQEWLRDAGFQSLEADAAGTRWHCEVS